MSKSLAMEIDVLERLNASCKAQEDRVWAAVKADKESRQLYTSDVELKVLRLERENVCMKGTINGLNDLVNQLRASLNGVLADFPKAVWPNKTAYRTACELTNASPKQKDGKQCIIL